MKKLICVIFAILMLLSLASCKKESGGEIPKTSESTAETELKTEATVATVADNSSQSLPAEDYDPGAMGGGEDPLCSIHNIDYHSIPLQYKRYVGEEKVDAWKEACNAEPYENDGCRIAINFYDFVVHFNIPNEYIINDYYMTPTYYYFDMNLELLLNRDKEGYEKFARNYKSREALHEKGVREEIFKSILMESIEKTNPEPYNKHTKNGTTGNDATWSIPQLVYEADISKDDLEKIYQKAIKSENNPNPIQYFEYDFDMIYEQRDYLTEQMKTLYPVQVDELLRKS